MVRVLKWPMMISLLLKVGLSIIILAALSQISNFKVTRKIYV